MPLQKTPARKTLAKRTVPKSCAPQLKSEFQHLERELAHEKLAEKKQLASIANNLRSFEENVKKELSETQNIAKTLDIEEKMFKSDLQEFEKDVSELKKKARHTITPHFTSKDLARVVIGSFLGMSAMMWESTVWDLGARMNWEISVAITLFTILGVSCVLYFSQYKKFPDKNLLLHNILPKRVAIVYLFSFALVFLSMLLLGINDFSTPPIIMLKRTILVSFAAAPVASAANII